MHAFLRTGAILAACLGSAVCAAAQEQPVRDTVNLTSTERATIYRIVTRDPTRIVQPSDTPVVLGAPVPRSVAVYEMPESVLAEVPVARRYRYVVVDRNVVLVDPVSSYAIGIIGE